MNPGRMPRGDVRGALSFVAARHCSLHRTVLMFYALFNCANNFQKIIEGLRMSLPEELHHISSYLHNLL